MNLTSVDDVKKMNPDVETEEFSSFFDLFKSCQMDDGEFTCVTTTAFVANGSILIG